MISANGMVILEAWWFEGGGIVLVQDSITLEYNAYVKPFKQRNGPEGYVPSNATQIEADMFHIASWGNKIPKEALQGFFPGCILNETKPFSETNPSYLL